MATIPSSIALRSILDGSQIVASDHRNNYSDAQTAINALITAISGGSNGQVFTSSGGTTVGWSTAGTIGNELDYKQITASQAFAVTSEGTAVAIVTGNSVSYDGTKCKIEVYYPKMTGTNGATYTGVLLRDSTVLGQFSLGQPQGAGIYAGITHTFYDTPSAGSHVYKFSAFGSDTSGVINAGAAGTGALFPAFLRVTKA